MMACPAPACPGRGWAAAWGRGTRAASGRGVPEGAPAPGWAGAPRRLEFHLLWPDQHGDRAGWRMRGLGRQPAQDGVHRGAVENAVNEVGVADETGQVRVDRPRVKILRGRALRYLAVPQDGYPVGGGQR